jgi:hypothetical protein
MMWDKTLQKTKTKTRRDNDKTATIPEGETLNLFLGGQVVHNRAWNEAIGLGLGLG